VGTITYYTCARTCGSPWLDRPDVAHFGQLAVDPAVQGRGLGTRLIATAEARARCDGAREIALDTAESAGHLIAWYERLGYRFVEYVDWGVTNYRSVVMSKRLTAGPVAGDGSQSKG
jgi:ribosomal protein S18 acetylase RimI-like enzyme